jgi:hypothetical protein
MPAVFGNARRKNWKTLKECYEFLARRKNWKTLEACNECGEVYSLKSLDVATANKR